MSNIFKITLCILSVGISAYVVYDKYFRKEKRMTSEEYYRLLLQNLLSVLNHFENEELSDEADIALLEKYVTEKKSQIGVEKFYYYAGSTGMTVVATQRGMMSEELSTAIQRFEKFIDIKK